MVSFIAFVPCLLLATVGIPGARSGLIGGFGMGMPVPIVRPIVPIVRAVPIVHHVPIAVPMMMKKKGYRRSKTVLGIKTQKPESTLFRPDDFSVRRSSRRQTNLYENGDYMVGGLGPVEREININLNTNGYDNNDRLLVLPRQREQKVVYMDRPQARVVYTSQDDEDKHRIALLNAQQQNVNVYSDPNTLTFDDLSLGGNLGGSLINSPVNLPQDNGYINDPMVVINEPSSSVSLNGGSQIISDFGSDFPIGGSVGGMGGGLNSAPAPAPSNSQSGSSMFDFNLGGKY